MQLKTSWLAGLGVLAIVAGFFISVPAGGTPLYAARAGRTCDNCHVTPNQWVNPDLPERKCTLSCQSCHVDPAGGGMRNASGRFFGRATLPVVATSPRPTQDWDRNLFGRRDKATSYSHNLPLGPSTFEESRAYADSVDDTWGRGTPAGSPNRYEYFAGRYGSLNANPLFRFGWDIRLATLLSGSVLTFPMQGDFPVLLHPVSHVSLFANTGFRGRSSGYSDTINDDHTPYLREAFLLINELPYASYLKAGRFTPSFGLRLDDHTSRIRREFELDGALPESRVSGVEIGTAPNYPFFQASYFKLKSRAVVPEGFNIFDVDDGWGGAVNAGYRDEGWTLGASGMMRRRPVDEGGDTTTWGVYGALNLWHYRKGLPFTYQLEYDRGTWDRASGLESDRSAFYQEVDWLFANGLNFLVAHDWSDPDHEVADDRSHRVQTGFQFTYLPGVTLDGRVRFLVPEGGGGGADLFFQLHLWN